MLRATRQGHLEIESEEGKEGAQTACSLWGP